MQNAVIQKVLHGVQCAWSKINDVFLGIKTDGFIRSPNPRIASWPKAGGHQNTKNKDNNVYQAADYRNLRRLVRLLQPNEEDVFYDIGCGEGRVVCVFGRIRLRLVVGIEVDSSLCDQARKNAEGLRGRRADIQIRCQDAARAELSDGTIYFVYNSFGKATMVEVLDKIHSSLAPSPRRLRIVYYNAVLEELFKECSWLVLIKQIRTFTGRPINVYETATQTH